MSLNIRPNNSMPGARRGEPQRRNASILGEQVRLETYACVTWCNPRFSQRLSRRAQSGFTLVELMVVIAVLAILATIAIPGFQGIVAQNRATSAANELQATLQFARSTAIAQSLPVTVCPADFDPPECSAPTTNWAGGWIVLVGGQVLREQRALHPSVNLTGVHQLIFSNTGTLAGQVIDPFDLQVTSGPKAFREISLSLGGSSKVTKVSGG